MEKNALVTVIVPIYNVEHYLEKCLESIMNQSYQGLEIILVDDGSTDGSGVISDNFARVDDRFKVIHKKNGGLSSARNVGLDICTGEWIVFVDSDDYVDCDYVESLYQACVVNSATISCCGRYEVNDDKIEKNYFFSNTTLPTSRALEKMLVSEFMDVSAWGKLYHKSIFDKIRFPIGEISEDVAIINSVIKQAKEIAHTGKCSYYYVRRSGSITASFSVVKMRSSYNNYRKMYFETLAEYPWLKQQAISYYGKAIMSFLNGYYNSIEFRKKNEEACLFYHDLYRELKHIEILLLGNKYVSFYYKIMSCIYFTRTYPILNRLKRMCGL